MFSNYFQPYDYVTGVEAMLDAFGQQWQPPAPGSGQSGEDSPIILSRFNIHITCEDSDSCAHPKSGTKSLAVTDSDAANSSFVPKMRFCPQFFVKNEPHTKNNLDSLPYIQNPRRRQSSWCKPGREFRDFEVAGITVLHELSHLNEAGRRANLESRDDG